MNDALGHAAPTPLAAPRLDGTAYALDWPDTDAIGSGREDMPTLDYAIYLINTVKFHLGQLYHIFDENTFESRLREFYTTSPEDSTERDKIWLVQLLVILALGKAFLSRESTNTKPPGAKYFERALALLPVVHKLYADPVTSVEAYCAIALYEQSIEHRNSAYTHVSMLAAKHCDTIRQHADTMSFPTARHCAPCRFECRSTPRTVFSRLQPSGAKEETERMLDSICP
jgi:proline utilization trans-activator